MWQSALLSKSVIGPVIRRQDYTQTVVAFLSVVCNMHVVLHYIYIQFAAENKSMQGCMKRYLKRTHHHSGVHPHTMIGDITIWVSRCRRI